MKTAIVATASALVLLWPAPQPAIPGNDYQCADAAGCVARITEGGELKEVSFRKGDIVSEENGWVVSTDDGWVKLKNPPPKPVPKPEPESFWRKLRRWLTGV